MINNWLVAGVSAAAASAVLYIIWGPSNKTKKTGLCRGLENLGNTCFLNVVLQAWASTPAFVSWLTEFLARSPASSESSSLARPLLHTLKVLNKQEEDCSDHVHSPADIIGTLRSKRWIISHDQQDAHELFYVLTSTLDEESTKFPSTVPLFDVQTLESPLNQYQPVGAAVTRSGGLLPVLPCKGTENPFRMLIASQLECVDCKYRHPVKYDLTDSLSLSFTRTAWSRIGLDVLLQKFITSEIVQDVECPGCKKIQTQTLEKSSNKQSKLYLDLNPKSSCLKRLTIGKLPQCLCLHMQRIQWSNSGIPYKKYEHVDFPETLVMDDYVYTKCEAASNRNGLLGGRALFGNTTIPVPTQPALVSPTSNHVNLLRALNYDSRISSSQGLFLNSSSQQQNQPSSLSPSPDSDSNPNSNCQPDINHNSPKAQESYTYKLTAVVMHLGHVFSGHFVTYRRAPPSHKRGERFNNQWLCTSDHAVKKVTLDEVLGAEAYMLFYERV